GQEARGGEEPPSGFLPVLYDRLSSGGVCNAEPRAPSNPRPEGAALRCGGPDCLYRRQFWLRLQSFSDFPRRVRRKRRGSPREPRRRGSCHTTCYIEADRRLTGAAEIVDFQGSTTRGDGHGGPTGTATR